jgi:hypothetical protein
MVRLLAAPLVAVIFLTTFNIGIAQAGLVATDDVAQENALSAQRDHVLTYLARDDVRQEMVNLGVDPNEAVARVAALSDSEISEIAQRIDQLPAGEGAVGAIVGALLLVFIVLLITDVAGVTDVFDFDD